MTGVAAPPANPAPAEEPASRVARSPVPYETWWRIGFVLVVAVGIGFRFFAHSALWLDEAQSVAIARLPLHGAGTTLVDGLRQDGSPPLYYLLLHGWVSLFGYGAEAVRALSAVISVLTIPPLYLLARRVVGLRAARVAVVIFVTSPFAIRYASEARMYSLVMLLSVLLGLALERTLRAPSWRSVVGLSVCSGALALTHYWCIYLLVTIGIWMVARGLHGAHDRQVRARLALLGLLGGIILFLPWLSDFRYQAKHTGTPWGEPASLAAIVHAYAEWSGGSSVAGRLGFVLVGALVALAIFGSALGPRQVLLDLHGHEPGRMLFFLTTGTLIVAVLVGEVLNTAYADRYTATAFVPFVLLAALGTLAIGSPTIFRGLVAVIAVLGLINGSAAVFQDRTQAQQVADVLWQHAGKGDVVLYCPDQLGPAVSRLAPPWLKQHLVPSYGPPDRVDWVDYAKRNEAADGAAIADRALTEASGHNIWLVTSEGYKTYEALCPAVQFRLQTQRPHAVALVTAKEHVFEHENLIWFLRH